MISIRLMTSQDVPLGMRLKEQAGWNQMETDWRRCLALQPDGCFVAEFDGTPVGTTTTCVFGTLAWVAMVLVDPAMRRRGIGQALLDHALAFLDDRGIRSVRLDATPLGRPLYEKRGFVEEYTLARYEGTAPSTPIEERVIAAQPEHREAVLKLDREATGTDRKTLAEHLFAESPEEWRVVLDGREIAGFTAARRGSRAWHIGPCAATTEVGALLLADALGRHAGQRVFVDIPVDHTIAIRTAERAGLAVQRPLFRMCRGPRPRECRTLLWAAFGPEKG
jgi:GNAT superfamily N-acetyltransferase